MTANDWIDRYIYAVTRRLPGRDRGEIGRELRALIGDMLEERCAGLAPSEQDVRLVLTQLGTPAQLARQYDPDGGKSLIGPGYYGKYKLVLRLVLAAVACGLVIANGVMILLGEQTVPQALLQTLGMVLWGLLCGFGLITLAFALFERFQVPFNGPMDGIENLPTVPRAGAEVPRGQSVAAIVLDVVALIVFLLIPQVIGVPTEGGLFPVLHVDFIRRHWYFPVLFFITGMTRDLCLFNEGRFTRKLAWLTLGLDALAALGSILFWGNEAIMNPRLPAVLHGLFGGEAAPANLIAHGNWLLLAVILFALLLDTIKAFVKARQADAA